MTLALLASLAHFASLVSTKRRSLGPIQGLEELSWVTRCYLAYLFFFFAFEDEPYEFERVPFIFKSFQRKGNTTYHSIQLKLDGRIRNIFFRQQYRINNQRYGCKSTSPDRTEIYTNEYLVAEKMSYIINIQEGIQL